MAKHLARRCKVGMTLLHGHDNWQHVQPTMDLGIRGWLILEEHANDFVAQAIEVGGAYNTLRMFYKETYRPGLASHTPDMHLIYLLERLPDVLGWGEMAQARGQQLGIQFWNELDPYDYGLAAQVGLWEAEMAALLAEHPGLVLVGGNYPTGSVSPELWQAYWNPALARLARRNQYKLGLHSYWPGSGGPWSWMGPWQGAHIMPTDGVLPDVLPPDLEAWAFARYQGIQLNIPVPPYVRIRLTEMGPDRYYDPRILDKGGYIEGLNIIRNTFVPPEGPEKFFGRRILGWSDAFLAQLPQVEVGYFFAMGSHHEATPGDGGQFADYDIARTNALLAWHTLVGERGWTTIEDEARQLYWWNVWRRATSPTRMLTARPQALAVRYDHPHVPKRWAYSS